MGTQSPLNVAAGPVKSVERGAIVPINDVDEQQLQAARQAIGRAIAKALARTGAGLKAFGDKGQVSRWCSGENPNLARLWLRQDVRRELVLALAEESGVADVEITVRMRRSA